MKLVQAAKDQHHGHPKALGGGEPTQVKRISSKLNLVEMDDLRRVLSALTFLRS